jgi:amino-acid N-acetyltransferase
MNTIQNVLPNDFGEMNHLLGKADLPLVQTTDHIEYFFKCVNEKQEMIGAIGLEIYGAYGLLRSLVVADDYRNKGIAKLLVEYLEKQAVGLGLKVLYLLTTTADRYFEKQAFVRVPRNEVHEEIKRSSEFQSICPVSAIIMYKSI